MLVLSIPVLAGSCVFSQNCSTDRGSAGQEHTGNGDSHFDISFHRFPFMSWWIEVSSCSGSGEVRLAEHSLE
jgi:hypothetical protein